MTVARPGQARVTCQNAGPLAGLSRTVTVTSRRPAAGAGARTRRPGVQPRRGHGPSGSDPAPRLVPSEPLASCSPTIAKASLIPYSFNRRDSRGLSLSRRERLRVAPGPTTTAATATLGLGPLLSD